MHLDEPEEPDEHLHAIEREPEEIHPQDTGDRARSSHERDI